MPKFAANLSMLYNEVPFMERFDKAGAAGFKAVEFLYGLIGLRLQIFTCHQPCQDPRSIDRSAKDGKRVPSSSGS